MNNHNLFLRKYAYFILLIVIIVQLVNSVLINRRGIRISTTIPVMSLIIPSEKYYFSVFVRQNYFFQNAPQQSVDDCYFHIILVLKQTGQGDYIPDLGRSIFGGKFITHSHFPQYNCLIISKDIRVSLLNTEGYPSGTLPPLTG